MKKTEEQFQVEVEEMHHAFRDICVGHKHTEVLLAIGYLLVDALAQDFYDKKLPLNTRIDDLMVAMKGIVVRLAQASRPPHH
jgi:hypothetical protein